MIRCWIPPGAHTGDAWNERSQGRGFTITGSRGFTKMGMMVEQSVSQKWRQVCYPVSIRASMHNFVRGWVDPELAGRVCG